MKKIDSTQNELIKHVVKLQDNAYRKKHQEFIAQHYTVCKTLYDNGYELQHLFMTTEAIAQHGQAFDREKIIQINNAILHKISNAATPSGIVGIFKIPQTSYTPTTQSILLYDLQDPGNLGTIIRTAAAMGIENVFTILGVDAYNPKVIQATAGTIAYINLIQTTWEHFAKEHAQFPLCALVVKNGKEPKNLNLSNSILIIGNEGSGLPDAITKACNQTLTIPMPGNTESLNAAIAASIALYIKTKKDHIHE